MTKYRNKKNYKENDDKKNCVWDFQHEKAKAAILLTII